jgi:tRNA threonylcarbamoyladenosine biosynthesis protein TsaB
MLILTIRTDKPEAEIGLYEDHKSLDYFKWEAHRELAETIHQKIKELLNSNGKDWHDIQGVVIYKGPGSFTGLRIGISVANALIYGLKCKGIGETGDRWIEEGIRRLLTGKGVDLIKPDYGSEPHITLPKR